MAYNRYAAFYGAYNTTVANGNTMSKEEVVKQFTEGKTGSLQDLSDSELRELVKSLNILSGSAYKPTTPAEIEKDKMRKAIISQFHQMHRTPSAAIAWAEKYGVNGKKKRFNEYSKSELFLLLKNAETVLADWRISIRKKVLPKQNNL